MALNTLRESDIRAMPAGNELDGLVAAALGWTNIRDVDGYGNWVGNPPGSTDPMGYDDLPAFSFDGNAMLEVCERLRADDWLVVVKMMPAAGSYVLQGSRSEYDEPCPDRLVGKGKVCVGLLCMRHARDINLSWRHDEVAFADTAPHGVCLAALLTKRG